MIGRLSHVAIAVPDLDAAVALYRERLGARCSHRIDNLGEGVAVVFVELANSEIELVAPLGPNSPIARFLERHPEGGLHHICYEVGDIAAARDRLVAGGARVVGSAEPRLGAHGKPVLFFHPKDFVGTLVELVEA